MNALEPLITDGEWYHKQRLFYHVAPMVDQNEQ